MIYYLPKAPNLQLYFRIPWTTKIADMKLLLSFISMFMISQIQAQLQYPVTSKGEVTDDYFGTRVPDPYRWLEDDNSPETEALVKQQNAVTQDYLDQIPFRDQVGERLREIWNYPRYGTPFKKGDWYYYYKNDGLQNQSVLYRTKDLTGKAEVFLDPNQFNTEGLAALSGMAFSKSGKLCAYSVARAGSDWKEIFVMDVEHKKLLFDKI